MRKFFQYPVWLSCLLLAYMPFHIFLSQSVSLLTGGLEYWKIAKDLIVLVSTPIIILILKSKRLLNQKIIKTVLLIGSAYLLIHLTYFLLNSTLDKQSTLLATVYNLRPIALLLIGIAGGYALESPDKLNKLAKLTLSISSLVALLAIIQYFLPKDILENFGYSIARGVKPIFYIDDKPNLPRVMSTIRDPNSLGAYLIVPITGLTVFIRKSKKVNYLWVFLLCLHLIALVLTFSRSAWVGLVLSVGCFLVIEYKNKVGHINTKTIVFITALVLIVTSTVFIAKNNYVVENVILHSDESTISNDPNELRAVFQKEAVLSILEKPQGYGPGTAGLVAISNPKGGLLTENYFLQIGYEVGLIGLALFCWIYAISLIGLKEIFSRQKNKLTTKFSLILFCSAVGYIPVALLNHLWSNEAVVGQWWVLTGIVIGVNLLLTKSEES